MIRKANGKVRMKKKAAKRLSKANRVRILFVERFLIVLLQIAKHQGPVEPLRHITDVDMFDASLTTTVELPHRNKEQIMKKLAKTVSLKVDGRRKSVKGYVKRKFLSLLEHLLSTEHRSPCAVRSIRASAPLTLSKVGQCRRRKCESWPRDNATPRRINCSRCRHCRAIRWILHECPVIVSVSQSLSFSLLLRPVMSSFKRMRGANERNVTTELRSRVAVVEEPENITKSVLTRSCE